MTECPNCGFQLLPANKSRATRLPADWVIPDAWLRWAMIERPLLNHKEQAAMFKDYWIAKSGKDASKLNWEATWRNWIRNAKSGPSEQKSTSGFRQSPSAHSSTPLRRLSDAERSKSLGTHLPDILKLVGIKTPEPSSS